MNNYSCGFEHRALASLRGEAVSDEERKHFGTCLFCRTAINADHSMGMVAAELSASQRLLPAPSTLFLKARVSPLLQNPRATRRFNLSAGLLNGAVLAGGLAALAVALPWEALHGVTGFTDPLGRALSSIPMSAFLFAGLGFVLLAAMASRNESPSPYL